MNEKIPVNEEVVVSILRENNFEVGEGLRHIYPDLDNVPDDYPWSRANRKGPLTPADRKNKRLTNYPLPCAIILNGELEYLNGDEPQVKRYHSEISRLIASVSDSDTK